MQCPILCPCRVRRTKCDWIEPFKANCIVNICHCRVCVCGRFRVVENVRRVVVYSSPSTCKYFALFPASVFEKCSNQCLCASIVQYWRSDTH